MECRGGRKTRLDTTIVLCMTCFRKKLILWTIEWRFHSTSVVTLDHGSQNSLRCRVNENASIFSEIQKHLQPGPWKNQLKQFCEVDLETLKCFIRKFPKGKSPFRELDIKAPIRQQIAHLSILEYPVIHVYLPSHSYDFEVVKDLRPVAYHHEAKSSSIRHDQQSPKGVAFKVEEIQEEANGSSEVQVYDLAKKSITTSPGNKTSPQKATTVCLNVVDSSVANDLQTCPAAEDNRAGIFDGMDFNFDPSLLDSYSDILAEIDTEDFLDFEGELPMGMESDDDKVFELEEGEIP
ncbi:hypothetical protein LINGRAHAP2_LOCUS8517 [Linum grandiflorum]